MVLVSSAAAQTVSGLDGDWDGALIAGAGVKLRLVLHVETNDGTTTATLISVDQGNARLPVEAIRRDGNIVALEVPAVRGHFEGVVAQDGATLTGTWTQIAALPLTLTRRLARTIVSSSYQYSSPIEPTFSDISYAPLSPSEKLDLYLPAAKDRPAPLIIWIHGGAFSVGDKRSMPRRNFGPPPKPTGPMGPYQIQVPDVAALTHKGYAVVSLNYRLLSHPGDKFIDYALPAVQDGKAAVRFLRANAAKYGFDPHKFAVWGNSAGGFMAAMLAATGDQPTVFDDPALGNAKVSSTVQAAVIWYGAIESDFFQPQIKISHYISEAKTVPPILIANGDADESVPAAGAIRLDQELLKKGTKSTLVILPGAGHEDPAFMSTQMLPTFEFLDAAFNR